MNEIQTTAHATNAGLDAPRVLTPDETAAVAGGPEIKNSSDTLVDGPQPLSSDLLAYVAGGPEIKNTSGTLVAGDDTPSW